MCITPKMLLKGSVFRLQYIMWNVLSILFKNLIRRTFENTKAFFVILFVVRVINYINSSAKFHQNL